MSWTNVNLTVGIAAIDVAKRMKERGTEGRQTRRGERSMRFEWEGGMNRGRGGRPL
jgi:hypothetical protein